MSHRFNPFAEARRLRKAEIIKYLANPNPLALKNGFVSARRLVGAFSTQWGISAKVIYEYLSEQTDAGLIKFEGEFIKINVKEEYLDALFGSRDAWQVPHPHAKE